MRIDISDRTDKDYPEPPECNVNGRDCTFSVENVCHECGKKMCENCSVGIRHQPRFSKFVYPADDGKERIQQHCPECADKHTLSYRNLGIGTGGIVVGLLLALLGTTDVIPITVVGLLLVLIGLFVTRFEYRMKVRHNDNHGITDML